LDLAELNVPVETTTGDTQIKRSHAEIPTVMDNTHSLEMASKRKVKRTLLLLTHGRDSRKVSLMLEFHALLSRDIQSLPDGEMTLISSLQESSVSNHTVSQESLIHQLTH